MSRWKADLDLAVEAVLAAGDVVMKSFRTEQEVRFKSPDQPLTDADLASNALLKQRLLGARPEYGWLSEETADTPARLSCDVVWLIDPIDGTRSYVAGHPEFSISVGLALKGEAVLGVVYNPATRELFTAMIGEGAFQDGKRLAVSRETRKPVIAASRSEIASGDLGVFEASHVILPTGSTAYKLAKVAAGVADIFVSRGPKAEWDLCAGALIVAEAGGKVTNLAGETLQYNRKDPNIKGVLAGTMDLHTDMLRRLQELN
ncbi:MAG TPA: 3'(2'),5'-bisphosphate nucleotidase CysQ [Longimicrobiales bacterium]|nr:3'(2'),5'-bisphosphate nucleotidase CysQ [Longimicrobiales bacterium]